MKVPMVVIHAAQVAHAKYYPLGPFASVTIAQWAIESGWGQFLSGKNNYFGIKATHEEIAAGHATLRWTHETFNGVYHPVQQWFANYDSIDDCFIAHARLLSTSQYYWKARQATTPDQYAKALEGIYATGIPGHPYGEVLINVMKNNLLYAYDLPMNPKANPPPTGQPGAKPMTESPTVTSSPATVAAPARVVPTPTQPVRIPWQDWLEQFLIHETPLIENVAQIGVTIAAGAIPGGVGTILLNLVGPTIVKQVVDGVLSTIEGPLSNPNLAIAIPANDMIATMAANVLNTAVPTFAGKAGDLLDGWIKTAVASLGR